MANDAVDKVMNRLERGLAMRDAQDPSRFIDVTHDDFVDDSLAVARRIYDHFDMPVTSAAQAAFEEQVAANPKGKHGSHEYSLEEYGLDPDEVRARFASYTDRFQISS